MFKKNESYKQKELFGSEHQLSKKQRKMWDNSIEHKFFETIFQNIDEDSFAVLYSQKKSRPNAPINQLVGSLILKHLNNWTYNDLFKQLSFNLLTRHAIGVQTIHQDIFSEASIFNFQNKVIEYYVATGVDLIANVFDQLTAQQLKDFGVDTSIQRGDSFLVGSNIIDYTRLHLIIEVLIRIKKKLSQKYRDVYGVLISKYTSQPIGLYLSKMSKEELPVEINTLAQIYHQMYIELYDSYKEDETFKIFERVYKEHFVIQQGKISVKPTQELTSDILMSPDDPEATFRRKAGVISKGYVGHISETAHPDNELNLITDVSVQQNNKDDGKILEERLPKMIEATPELAEYFADGLYSNEAIDELTKANGITQYQTGVRGRKSTSQIEIEKDELGNVWVSCKGGQRIKAEQTTRWKAEFDLTICQNCPLHNKCTMKITGGKRTPEKRIHYFADKHILAHARMANIKSLPEEKRKIRANVEATVKEMKRGMKNGKVRIRGRIRVSMHMHFTALGINLTRITKIWTQKLFSIVRILYKMRGHQNYKFSNKKC
jgi:hypothetical protein